VKPLLELHGCANFVVCLQLLLLLVRRFELVGSCLERRVGFFQLGL
jgi:hypothetical protein